MKLKGLLCSLALVAALGGVTSCAMEETLYGAYTEQASGYDYTTKVLVTVKGDSIVSVTFAEGSNTTINYNNMITRMDVGNEYALKFVADEEVPVTNNGTITTVNDWYIHTTQSGLFMTRTGNYAISNADGLIAFRNMMENKTNLTNTSSNYTTYTASSNNSGNLMSYFGDDIITVEDYT